MDKALKEIKEKELILKELEGKKETNNVKIKLTRNIDLISSVENLNASKAIKEKQKDNCLETIEKLKKLGSSVIWLVFFGILTFDILFFFSMPIPRDLTIFKSTLIYGVLFTGIMTSFYSFEKHNFKKLYKSLDKEITEISSQLEKKNPLLEEMYSKLDVLNEESVNLDNEINEIKNRIEKLNQIRSEVIESFCKDNKNLHLLLDQEYNKSENVKQKVNKK